jgi:hypothetical protein
MTTEKIPVSVVESLSERKNHTKTYKDGRSDYSAVVPEEALSTE